MLMTQQNILSLLEYVKIDRFYVSFHFKCPIKGRTVVSIIPFEPYSGKIVITWKDVLLHPMHSYNRYYHTPITIYGNDSEEALIVKAFKKVSSQFIWNNKEQKYVYN
ncbi:MAG: divergent polysaccharide deacetylase family protein [Epsilonproteobacteria bacterium]|nr:divergent polysaccharide deacetylase family protein [Campylobacterota bacterium]OIO13921.1 MAG: hypothetical protein AUJ81_10570 [Helicobacteraceae bacterium CG1_02_36_14]PIP10845.1 MAG: hypothetical protein COX50_03740 [Sulfurimonas sp. CG23_combo_of_CG06-09_8_20_14_all_36_33]PIS24470.1 MAG: hypothetical protein COT46_09190 [Sulfurimonas sp. CG08_land_8_20_14_0_20_36_33]PIU33711.1 MAG: hypothetical protein COT05_10985 [Sulfurimonas sp. CG07_land_8_20_14_0_80_36_56]PIV03501.1 MAG: hypotheti